jgi:hypothetical protein
MSSTKPRCSSRTCEDAGHVHGVIELCTETLHECELLCAEHARMCARGRIAGHMGVRSRRTVSGKARTGSPNVHYPTRSTLAREKSAVAVNYPLVPWHRKPLQSHQRTEGMGSALGCPVAVGPLRQTRPTDRLVSAVQERSCGGMRTGRPQTVKRGTPARFSNSESGVHAGANRGRDAEHAAGR